MAPLRGPVGRDQRHQLLGYLQRLLDVFTSYVDVQPLTVDARVIRSYLYQLVENLFGLCQRIQGIVGGSQAQIGVDVADVGIQFDRLLECRQRFTVAT